MPLHNEPPNTVGDVAILSLLIILTGAVFFFTVAGIRAVFMGACNG